MSKNRELIFISHANPEDNAFTLWLATRLTAAGYLVWSDVTKLFGAELFWEDIEEAIRIHAAKFIIVLSRMAQQKPGVLDEVAVAVSVERVQEIERFVVPIRIDDLPFSDLKPNLTRKNIIDFKSSWAEGFHKLIKVLERDHVPFVEGKTLREISCWIEKLFAGPEKVVQVPEAVFSNWISFKSIPDKVNFLLIPTPANQLRNTFEKFEYPAYPYQDMLATFASTDDIDNYLPSWQKATIAYKILLSAILNHEPHQFDSLKWPEASAILTYLFRTAWDNAMRAKGLYLYEMASGKRAWYPMVGFKPDNKAYYIDINGVRRWRKLVGKSEKKNVYWHFGIEAWPLIGESPLLVIRPHVVFTNDGRTPLSDEKKMHRIRRSFCKNWWNARWRDLMLAFMAWVANEQECIEIPVGLQQVIRLNARPLVFETQVSLTGIDDSWNKEDETESELDAVAEEFDDVSEYDLDEETFDESEIAFMEGKDQ